MRVGSKVTFSKFHELVGMPGALLVVFFFFLTPIQHCVRHDNIWVTPDGHLCGRIDATKDDHWQALARVGVSQRFDSAAEAAAWIEASYCKVDQ